MEDMEVASLRPSPHDKRSAPEDVHAANLTVIMKYGSFMELVAAIKYSGFLKVLEICNGPLKPYMRPAVELRWSNLLREEYSKWVGAYQVSEELKRRQWDRGLAQCSATDAEDFWAQKVTEKQKLLEGAEVLGAQKDDMDTVEDSIKITNPASWNFLKLKENGYKAFLTKIFNANGTSITRGVAEGEWKNQCNKLFSEWNPPAKYETREEIDGLLKEALDQINGIGRYHPITYWLSEDPNSLRRPEITEKAATKAAKRAAKREGKNQVPLKPVRIGRVEKKVRKAQWTQSEVDQPRRVYNTRSRNTVSHLEALVSQLGL